MATRATQVARAFVGGSILVSVGLNLAALFVTRSPSFIFANVPWIVAAFISLVTLGRGEAKKTPLENVRFAVCDNAVVCLMIVTFFFFLLEAGTLFILLSQADFGLHPFPSPCGQSSCSRSTTCLTPSQCPYNPLGFFPRLHYPSDSIPDPSAPILFCPVQNCRWADANGQVTIQGYAPDQHLAPILTSPQANGVATTNASDYPDRARGLMDGMFKYGTDPTKGYTGSTVTNVVYCPGVIPALLTSKGFHGRGQPVCSLCGPVPPGCPAPLTQAEFICALCLPTTQDIRIWFGFSCGNIGLLAVLSWAHRPLWYWMRTRAVPSSNKD